MRTSLLIAAGLVLALACPGTRAQEDKEPELITRLKKAKVDGPFTLAVLFKVKEGQEKALRKAAAPCIKATRKEKGCVTYRLHQDLESPQQFVMYERWKSIQALEDHFKTAHFKKLIGELKEIVDGPARFHIFRSTDKE